MLAAEAEVARATEGRRIPPPPPPRSTSRCRKGSSRPRRARCHLRAKSYYAAAEACRVTGREQWPVGRIEEDSGGGGRWVVLRRTLEAAGGASRGGLQHLSLSLISLISQAARIVVGCGITRIARRATSGAEEGIGGSGSGLPRRVLLDSTGMHCSSSASAGMQLLLGLRRRAQLLLGSCHPHRPHRSVWFRPITSRPRP